MLYETIDESDMQYEQLLDAYYNVRKYNPFGDSIEKKIAKIIYIDDDNCVYDKTIFMVWSNPEIDESDESDEQTEQEDSESFRDSDSS